MRISDEHAVKAVLVNDGLNDRAERRMFLWLDVGEFDATGMPVLTYCQLDCQAGLGIEEAFNRLPHQRVSGLVVPRELQEQCLRIVVSVCFLATSTDRLIDPEGAEQGSGPLPGRPRTRTGRGRATDRQGTPPRQDRLECWPARARAAPGPAGKARGGRWGGPRRPAFPAPAAGPFPAAAEQQGDVRPARDREAGSAGAGKGGGLEGESVGQPPYSTRLSSLVTVEQQPRKNCSNAGSSVICL